MSSESKPVLWHIPVSHYNEKVRWALAWKQIEHERRAPPPPANMAVAGLLTRGRSTTFPVLQLDGRALGDSSEIIAALEQRQPAPPLYPASSTERRHALALEEFFDEELGPHVRLLAWHELLAEDGMEDLVERALPPAVRGFAPARAGAVALASAYVSLRYRVTEDARAEEARTKITAAMDRLEEELGEDEYLVGERFSVADLTAAALFYPLVRPPEGPTILGDPPPALERFRQSLADRGGFRYVEEMFRRHRKRAPSPVAA